jgi:hypothetical protein
MTSNGFLIGDQVTWKSQAGGFWKEKTGTIVEIVPPKQIPKLKGVGLMGRGLESYVVQVGNKKYWPVVSTLKLADKGEVNSGITR